VGNEGLVHILQLNLGKSISPRKGLQGKGGDAGGEFLHRKKGTEPKATSWLRLTFWGARGGWLLMLQSLGSLKNWRGKRKIPQEKLKRPLFEAGRERKGGEEGGGGKGRPVLTTVQLASLGGKGGPNGTETHFHRRKKGEKKSRSGHRRQRLRGGGGNSF